ncbi:MAG: exodeoxyribonuclease VII small subunit [Proteobacteria bacterium]|nr:exodeoxyribonuclease VII small subunit [Pseudomonadota bacterium]
MPKKSNTINFEKTLAELESLVETMEQGDLSLEESLKYFERGIELTKSCQKALTEAEQKVKILIEKQGNSQLGDFDSDDTTQD